MGRIGWIVGRIVVGHVTMMTLGEGRAEGGPRERVPLLGGVLGRQEGELEVAEADQRRRDPSAEHAEVLV